MVAGRRIHTAVIYFKMLAFALNFQYLLPRLIIHSTLSGQAYHRLCDESTIPAGGALVDGQLNVTQKEFEPEWTALYFGMG